MDIQAEKIELLKMLLETNNPKVIESVKNIFRNQKPQDFWEDLNPYQQKEITNASREVSEGMVSDYDKFIKKHR